MAPNYPTLVFFSFLLSLSIRADLSPSSTLIEELNKPPPPEFPAFVSGNCVRDPSLRYCNSAATDLHSIFKSTVVAHHLCLESNNTDCHSPGGFAKIDLRSRPRLAPLYLSFSFFWRYCPLTVLDVNLSNNSLNGPFPSDVLRCSQIHSLDLSHNHLSGDIDFSGFANLTNLSFLNLSYNKFSESHIDLLSFFKQFNSSSFLHSGLLSEDHRHGFKVTATLLLLIGVLVSIVSTFGSVGWVMTRRPDLLPWFLWRKGKFTSAMLKKFTNGFAEDNIVRTNGRSGASIYTGKLRNGVEVEIHLWKGRIDESYREAFVGECRTLMQIRHKNLAKVIGWCQEREMRAIVMEKVSGCNVEEWLRGSPPWKQRLKLLSKVTEGISYLQKGWPQVGFDLRTKAILLTRDFEPIVSKLKVSEDNQEHKKVHRVGLFLLELVVDKHKLEAYGGGQSGLIELVRLHHHQGQVIEVIDDKMKLSSTSLQQIKKIVDIGLSCLELLPEDLPRIDKILRLLGKTLAPMQVQAADVQHRQLQKQAR